MLRGKRHYRRDENRESLTRTWPPASLKTREGLDHFGVAVDDMDATASALKAKKVRFVEDPMQVRPGLRIAYIEAPDKVRIELSERT